MEITWSIDAEAGLVRLKYEGPPNYATWETVMLEIFSHPKYRPGLGFVADLTKSDVPDASHVRRVAAFFSGHQDEMRGGRWANVTDRPAHFGMTRMGQVFAEELPAPLQVFSSTEEAEAWAAGGSEPDRS